MGETWSEIPLVLSPLLFNGICYRLAFKYTFFLPPPFFARAFVRFLRGIFFFSNDTIILNFKITREEFSGKRVGIEEGKKKK